MKFSSQKRNLSLLLLVFVVTGVFLCGRQVGAGVAGAVLDTVVGGVLGLLMKPLGGILSLVIQALVAVASYQQFINVTGVINGWKIVRDVCNMFFVVVLMIIAFGTILHREEYSYKKWLGKLVLMAVLINFSKTICGLLIDVSQVAMLTFVNAFKDIGGGNMTEMLGITSIVTASEASGSEGIAVIGAYVLGILYLIISIVVILTMVMMLVMRIVMIWIYVVLSPMAYLMSAFPGGDKYAGQWWDEFVKNLIVGPVLAFFIWLSFAILQAGNNVLPLADGKDQFGTTGSTAGALVKFVLAIGMLVGGLMTAQSIGGAAGGMAGKGLAKLKSGAATAGGWTKKKAMGGVKGTFKAAGRGAGNLALGAANKMNLKEGLARTAASESGWAKYTGVGALATSGLGGLNKQNKAVQEKAAAKLADIKDTRVLSRFANEKKSIGASGNALRDAARDMMPHTIRKKDEREKHLRDMSVEKLGKLTKTDWHAIGQSDTKLDGNSLEYIKKNHSALGAYNNIQADGGGVVNPNRITGLDKNDNPLEGDKKWGNVIYNSQLSKTVAAPGTHYSVDPEDANNEKNPRGQGQLAINELMRGQSDTVAVDFDKLKIDEIQKGGKDPKDWRGTKGLNTNDPAMMKKIAASMVKVISDEMKTLKDKPSLGKGDEKRLANLQNAKERFENPQQYASKMVEAFSKEIKTLKDKQSDPKTPLNKGEEMHLANLQKAKERFENPEQLNNLSLVNSSAANFDYTKLKKTKIHEEAHGLGYASETDVNSATEVLATTGGFQGRGNKAVNEVLLGKKQSRPVRDIIKDENSTEQKDGDVSDVNDKVQSPVAKKVKLSKAEQRAASQRKKREQKLNKEKGKQEQRDKQK